MTEPPPDDFATAADVVGRWRTLTPAESTKAELHLGDASAIIRSVVADIDARIAANPALARTALTTVVNAVIRLMQNPNGAKRVQETIGDRAYTLDFGDGQATGLFITDEEMAPLMPSGVGGQSEAIGTAIVATRPGWAHPYTMYSTHSADWWPNDG